MSQVRLDLTERVAWITLDRPPLNLLNRDVVRELETALAEVAKNHEASLLVISGAGDRAFTAGLDITDFQPADLQELRSAFHLMLRRLVHQPQATLAAIDGVALAGGLELANACDLVVSSSRSRFGYPQIQTACFPPVALVLLPTICGRPVGSDLVLTGEIIDAQHAARLGLVSRVFETEVFDEELRLLVTTLADHSPDALRLTAQQLRSRWLGGFDTALDEISKVFSQELLRMPAVAEGIRAFQEKRKPVWR